MPYYSVQKGFNIGVYKTWEECQAQVTGFKGAKFKKFKTLDEAQKFLYGIEPTKTSIEPKRKVKDDTFEYTYMYNMPGVERPIFCPAIWRSFYYIFTDGSYQNRPDLQFKAGYGVYTYNFKIPNPQGRNNHSHNFCEIMAIYQALKLVIKIDDAYESSKKTNTPRQKYIIASDSQYVLRSISHYMVIWKHQNWLRGRQMPIQHQKLWQKIHGTLLECDQLEIPVGFLHVSSHKKKPENPESLEYYLWFGNQNADRLATGKPTIPFDWNFTPHNAYKKKDPNPLPL